MTNRQREVYSAFWHALGKVGGKEGNRTALGEGKSYPVNLRIRGTVCKQEINEQIAGLLLVAFDSEGTTTSGPEGDHLTALILSRVPKTRQAELLESLSRYFAEHGALPEIDEELLDQITHLRKQLRARSAPTTKRGAVSFSHAAASTA